MRTGSLRKEVLTIHSPLFYASVMCSCHLTNVVCCRTEPQIQLQDNLPTPAAHAGMEPSLPIIRLQRQCLSASPSSPPCYMTLLMLLWFYMSSPFPRTSADRQDDWYAVRTNLTLLERGTLFYRSYFTASGKTKSSQMFVSPKNNLHLHPPRACPVYVVEIWSLH